MQVAHGGRPDRGRPRDDLDVRFLKNTQERFKAFRARDTAAVADQHGSPVQLSYGASAYRHTCPAAARLKARMHRPQTQMQQGTLTPYTMVWTPDTVVWRAT